MKIGPDIRHYSDGRFHRVGWKQVSKQRDVGPFQPNPGEGGHCLAHRLHNVTVITPLDIPNEVAFLPQPRTLIMGQEFRTIFHEIVRIHRERLVFLFDQRIDVFGRGIGTCLQVLLQDAPDLVSAKWILSMQKARGVRDALFEMTMGILRETVVYQILDAYAEFPLCDFEQLL